MQNTKRCPVGLDGFQHYCPDDPSNHEPLSKIKSYLERKFEGMTEADIAEQPWNQKHWETLRFIRNGCKSERPKIQTIKPEMTSKVETGTVPQVEPVITAEQKKALDDLAKLKEGIPFSRSYTPQTETKTPIPSKTMSFEERLIHDWKTNSSIRAEFTSLNSYTAYMKAQREGKAKIHRGCVMK